VHDLRFIRLRSKFRKYILKKLYLDLPVRRLKFITAVSEFTKKEIVENTGCDPSKIRVLELPVLDHPAARSEKALFNKESPLLLQVGTMPNKNIERLIEAVSGSDCRLKIVGKLSKSQTSLIETSGVEYECVMGLCDDEMASEYRNADIVTFCSTYEGFGLPIIEAQAAGTPVITSNISPMTETSGGAAALADPFDTDSIRKTIQRVIEDGNYRNDLIETGFKNAERFSADRIAAAYAHLYKEIACTNVGGAS
jgi:glycosyltransferase involved in cell wall biosynthesis